MRIKPLLKQEVIEAIEGKTVPSRVPSTFSIWPPSYGGIKLIQAVKCLLENPSDIKVFYTPSYLIPLIHGNNILLFNKRKRHGQALDASAEVVNMEDLDSFLKRINNPNKVIIPRCRESKKYKLAVFWNFLFESLWQIRGMDNALTDFYLYPDEVHRIFRAITDFYKELVIKSRKNAKCDGFFISDDMGHQTSSFFSPEIFKGFFYPYYKELIDTAHSSGMHLWLHTCGNIENLLPMLIELKLDVIHPIQKYAMDEKKIVSQYKDKICYLYGFDVQQVIPYGTTEEVIEEVHRVYDLFVAANGRMVFTPGNAITPNCPIESFKALIRESKRYNPYVKK